MGPCFYAYRSWTGERAPEGLDAFYVEFYWKDWELAGRMAEARAKRLAGVKA